MGNVNVLLTRRDVAEILGITVEGVKYHRTNGSMPQPDVIVDSKPLWNRDTIDNWITTRGEAEMSDEDEMTTRDKLEKILRLADLLLIEMDEDIEESDEEPRKRIRGPGFVGEKPAKQNTRWSEADDEHLRLMLKDNWQFAKIASRLERTVKSVEQRPVTMKRMGIW